MKPYEPQEIERKWQRVWEQEQTWHVLNPDESGFDGSVPKSYVLNLSYAQTLSTPVVDTASGRALSATLTGNLTYTLRQGSTIVTTGVATSLTTYDRFEQRFATVRAARDAEIRLARELAGQVRTRLQAELSRR